MRIRALKPFLGPNWTVVEVGEELEVTDQQAKEIITRGYAEEVRPAPPQQQAQGKGPLWSYRIQVSQERNLTLEVWPPREGSQFQTPSISLVDGRKNEKGDWENTRVYLAWGVLLELAEALREAWRKHSGVSG